MIDECILRLLLYIIENNAHLRVSFKHVLLNLSFREEKKQGN